MLPKPTMTIRPANFTMGEVKVMASSEQAVGG
jgi:hypothetical protein